MDAKIWHGLFATSLGSRDGIPGVVAKPQRAQPLANEMPQMAGEGSMLWIWDDRIRREAETSRR